MLSLTSFFIKACLCGGGAGAGNSSGVYKTVKLLLTKLPITSKCTPNMIDFKWRAVFCCNVRDKRSIGLWAMMYLWLTTLLIQQLTI